MKYLLPMVLFVLALGNSVRAQEPELVSEIVARVNNDIITRADYLKAVADFEAQMKEEMIRAGKPEAEIAAQIAKTKSTILDLMIEDILLEQKAKELNIDVEAEVNQQMIELAKQNGFKTLAEFEAALKQQGVDPENGRASIRKSMQQQYVVNREVLRPIFESLSEKDRLDFYNRHKKEFTSPAEMTISEIFLALDNQTANEVEQRARRIVAEIRAGKNFVEAVQQYSAATRPTRALNGKIGKIKLEKGEIKDDLFAALKDLKTGDVTEPMRQQDGYAIIHVDERKDEATREYKDPEVQKIINQYATMERADEARKKYLKKLRAEAFVEINKNYIAATTEQKPDKQ